MKTILHLKLALILVLVLPQVASSQFTNHERDTKWNIGFNMGAVWQDSDIKLDRPGFGYGFTIGKGIYESPGKFWSVDARFRYMKGFTFGQELTKLDSIDIIDNTIYSSNPSNYKNTLGYTYLNSKTMIHDFSLEAVLNFHMLRERTGVLLSVFGGIGVTDYKTRTNLLNYRNFNKIYNYNTLDLNNVSKRDLRNLQDDEYETRALYNDEDATTVRFMPSLGIGLGYQITPQWSFGFEHKVTFVLQDEFDGLKRDGTEFLQWGNNDKYHYSSVFLRLNIFRGGDYSDPVSSDKCPPPYIKITDVPNNYVVNEQLLSIRARVSKIKNNNDIILVSNDQMLQTTYNKNTDYVTGNVMLVEGENKILFIATNSCGESMDSVIVIYNPESCPKALITITEPTDVLTTKKARLIAKVLQLQGGTLQVKLNNTIITHQYNANSRVLTADLELSVGANVVSIQAINKCGDTTVFKNIEYNCIPPTVVITYPVSGKKYESQSNEVNFTATAINISELSQIQVLVDGVVLRPAFNKSTGVISGIYDMKEGSNTVSVKVTNDCGTQTKTIQFTYEKPCLFPVVSISSPRNNQNVTSSSVTITGGVTNIKSNSNVQLKVNGVLVNSNFNNGRLSTVVNLRMGANTIQLSGMNECGTDSEIINITYNCPKPFVNIISPSNGSSLSSGNTTIKGTVSNVSSKSQINVTVNGNAIPFTYTTNSKTFSASANFISGQNVIVVNANTACGIDSKTSIISVSAPCPSPAVSISSPQNGSNFSNSVISLTGTAMNVSNQSQMRVALNGVNQSFSYNSGSRTFNSSLNLRSGNNTIVVSATTNCGMDSKSINISYNAPCPSPLVSISSPRNGLNSTSATVSFLGAVKNVTSSSQITLKVNGVLVNKNFNATTKIVSTTLNLKQGANTIELSAINSCGADNKVISISFRCPLPIINIASPNTGMGYTTNPITFSGFVSGVSAKNQITIALNGAQIPFTYTTSTSKFEGNITLMEGSNTLIATVTNQCGTVTKSTSVTYKKPCPKPIVTIINPTNGFNPVNQYIAINGVTINITSKSQITLTLNGVPIPFTFNASSNSFNTTYDLTEGSNVIIVTVTNSCGTQSKTVTIGYIKPCPKPTLMFTSPLNGVSVSSSAVTITGVANNLITKADMQLKLNGVNTAFTYNAIAKTFSATATLINGNNTILATVATSCGKDSKTINLSYSKPCPKPTVTIINPTSGFTPVDQYITINGVTTNIASKSQMTLTLNGVLIPFTFNASSNSFNTTYDLTEGNNVITATVTNNCGTQSKTVTIGYTKPCPKPTVTIINPINGFTPVDQYITINGVTTNIVSKSQMTLTLNGVSIPFTFNASSNSFNTTYDLTEGNNVITATLTNSCGTQSKTVTIGYTKPCPKPTVSISRPSNGASVTGNKIVISGVAQNLVSQSDMQVRVNGVSQSFSFNAGSGVYSATLTLRAGKNTISVDVATNCGNDSKTISVTSVLVKPIIRVSNPEEGKSSTSSIQMKVLGEVEKISSQSQFTIKVNGTIIKGYTFTKIANEKYAFNSLVSLRAGVNVVTITAIHSSGTTEVVKRVINVTSKINSSGSKEKGEEEKPSSGGTKPVRGTSKPRR